MLTKKLVISTVLCIASLFTGGVFGLLDIMGFVDGRHALSFTLLLASAGLLYAVLILTFLLTIADELPEYRLFGVASTLFAISFFAMRPNPFVALLATLLYFGFLMYVYRVSKDRASLFIKFSPREIFFPILKHSFTFFLVVLALLSYTQSQKLVSSNSLISPSLIRLVSKPTIFMLNQQINAQMQSGVSAEILDALPERQRKQVVYTALKKTVEQMASPQTGTVYGIHPDEFPVHLARISPSNAIDITPVIEAMLPTIAYRLNVRIQDFALLAPFAVAMLTFLLLQPLIIPLGLVESLLTLGLFQVLLSTKFIKLSKVTREVEVPSLSGT